MMYSDRGGAVFRFQQWRTMSCLLVSLFLIIVTLNAKEPTNTSTRVLRKSTITDPAINRARAYLDKGKLKVGVDNYGVFCGKTSPEGLWGDFQYISDLSLMVGVPGKDKDGNPYPWAVGRKTVFSFQDQDFVERGEEDTYWGPTVSEAWFDRTANYNRVDWEAVEDASIFLHNPQATAGEHYGELGLWTFREDPYPLIATSDIPETWPLREDAQGNQEHFWPGPWAQDPADTTGETILEGVFVSDQDIYFEFDDRLATRDIDPNQGYPMLVRATVSAFSYSASISEDIIFFKMYLHNDSEYHYKDVYAGFYFDVDSYNRLADGNYAGRTNDDDMMAYNTEYDYGYIYDLDDNSSGFTDLAYSAVKLLDTPVATEEIDLDANGTTDIYPGDVLGLTSWHWFDWYFRPGAKDGGLNGPFSGDGETPVQDNKEEIQYKILAGDTTNLSRYDSTHFFHPERGPAGFGRLNPRFDSVEGLLYEYPDGLDCVFIMGSGPFNLAPGDSVPFSFCILMGEDEDDLVTNAKIAQLMYDNNYQGARAPKAPNVVAKEEDQKVTLYWDATSIHDTDIITGYEDFQGFRIYKSTDLGKTWGTRYYDEESRVTYWEPVAQFDLDDDIEGYEPLPPHRYLGSNTGIQYTFVDENVQNGMEYLYAICAYDKGFIPGDPLFDPDDVATSRAVNFEIPSLENLLSNSTNLPHIVRAIPHRPASNVTSKELRVEKIAGTIGTGVFNVEVIDPLDVTGHIYKILFDCSYEDSAQTIILDGSQSYTIYDSTAGNSVLLDSSKEYSTGNEEPESPPVIDGMRWSIKMAPNVLINSDDAYWVEGSSCTYDIIVKFATPTPGLIKADYEIRFLGEGVENVYDLRDYDDGIENILFTVPFEVWNTVENQKAVIVARKGSRFEQKLELNLREEFYPSGKSIKFEFDWIGPDSLDPETNEPLLADAEWKPGDVMVIPVRKPFERGDGFIVNTEEVFRIHDVADSNIAKVKVVPNPYVVNAGWENDDFVRKLQFTNLPNKCKIHIFNMAAEKVITLQHDSSFDGSEDWDLLTSNRQETAPGLYVFVVETDDGKTHSGKFVIIK